MDYGGRVGYVRIESVVCDVCGKDASEYVVRIARQARRVDLCEEHARPLKELWKLGTPVRKRSQRTKTEDLMVSDAELEARKRVLGEGQE